MNTTVGQVKSFAPYQEYTKNLILRVCGEGVSNDMVIPLTKILDTSGIYDTIWVLGQMGQRPLLAQFACDCAERAQPVNPEDRRPLDAIEAVRDWLENPTEDALERGIAARRAARQAVLETHFADHDHACAALHAADYVIRNGPTADVSCVVSSAVEAGASRDWQVNRLREQLEKFTMPAGARSWRDGTLLPTTEGTMTKITDQHRKALSADAASDYVIARRCEGVSQVALSRVTGLARRTIQRFEHRLVKRPRITTLIRLYQGGEILDLLAGKCPR